MSEDGFAFVVGVLSILIPAFIVFITSCLLTIKDSLCEAIREKRREKNKMMGEERQQEKGGNRLTVEELRKVAENRKTEITEAFIKGLEAILVERVEINPNLHYWSISIDYRAGGVFYSEIDHKLFAERMISNGFLLMDENDSIIPYSDGKEPFKIYWGDYYEGGV